MFRFYYKELYNISSYLRNRIIIRIFSENRKNKGGIDNTCIKANIQTSPEFTEEKYSLKSPHQNLFYQRIQYKLF